MKRTKLLKHLHAHGCKYYREGGRHTIYTNADETRKTAVPRHPEIKPNLVRKVCKDLDIPVPDEK
jgi:predicted RNA binding protein YcfA (HicA-like mRNA interferase family)